MGIRIFFILSFLLLLSGMVFVHKVPEKVSLFRSMVICYLTELCFGAVVVGIYLLTGIPIGLLSLGIAYFIMGVALWSVIALQGRIQKVQVVGWDVYAALVIVLWFSFIFTQVFSLSIHNVYTNSDPANHFQNASRVMYTGKASAMYFAEVYNGMVMGLLEPFLTRLTLYKAFVLADSFANLVNVFMFFCLIATFVKSRFSKAIVPFLSCLYFLGWPFFSYAIGGFVYFGWGVTLFAYVVYLLVKLYESGDKRNQIILTGLVLIGSFSLLVCYLLFVVILAGVVLLSLMYTAGKNGFVVSRKRILRIGIAVLLLATGIFSFCFWGFFGGDLTFVLSALQTDGGIAKELYQDFVFLMPGVFYMGWRYIRHREVNIIYISASVILAFICFTFIMCLYGIMSPYYYYKSYYLLWLFAWIINVAFMEYLFAKDKAMLFSFGGTLLAAIFITISGADSKLAEKGIVVDEVSFRWYPSPFPIWDRMEIFIGQRKYFEDNEALIDVSDFVNKEISGTGEVPIIVELYWAETWYYCYTGNSTIYISSDEEYVNAIQDCIDGGYKYFVLYQNTQRYRDNKELLSDYENVYDNGYYGVYMLY